MSRTNLSKPRKPLGFPWTIRRYKDRIVIEIRRERIPVKPAKTSRFASPDCRPEIW
jgi:hypothetical protein